MSRVDLSSHPSRAAPGCETWAKELSLSESNQLPRHYLIFFPARPSLFFLLSANAMVICHI